MLTPEDEQVIDAHMDAMTEDNLPAERPEPVREWRVKPPMVQRICDELEKPGGVRCPEEFVYRASRRGKPITIEAVNKIIRDHAMRISEIASPPEPIIDEG